MAEEGKTESTTSKRQTAGLDADVVQIGAHSFQVTIEIIEDEKGASFLIRAVEIKTKDVFEFIRDEKSLLAMNWPHPSIESVKQFITSIAFDPDEEMRVQYGFVANEEDEDEQKSENDSEEAEQKGKEEELELKETYNEGDDMVMLLELKYKWVSSNWRLHLKYVPQDEVKRLRVLVKELRAELDDVKSDQAGLKGMIMMWSGQQSDIPNGWAICNGQNGTPDLRDKFILGGNSGNIGSRGGSKTHSHNITVHGHTLTINEIPKHNHEYAFRYYEVESGEGVNMCEVASYPDEESFRTGYTGGGGSHSHSASSGSSSHMPPYYVLGFVMKLK